MALGHSPPKSLLGHRSPPLSAIMWHCFGCRLPTASGKSRIAKELREGGLNGVQVGASTRRGGKRYGGMMLTNNVGYNEQAGDAQAELAQEAAPTTASTASPAAFGLFSSDGKK